MTKRQRISYHSRAGEYKNRERSSDEDEGLDLEDKDRLTQKIQEWSKAHPEQVTELQSSQWEEMHKFYDKLCAKKDKEELEKKLEKMKFNHNKQLLTLLLKQQVERDPVIDPIAVYNNIDSD